MPTFLTTRYRRWLWRVAHAALVVLLAFAGAVLVGLCPVNRNFRDAEQGIELFVYVDAAHSEVIVPIRTAVRDWGPWFSANDFKNLTGRETYISFGWGDRDFFLTTPTWDDIRASTVASSMFLPTTTVMHVMLSGKPSAGGRYHRVVIDEQAYAQLVSFVESHFVLDGSAAAGDLRPVQVPGYSYGNRDAFYQAVGTYSLLYTCNAWTSDALQVAGIRTGRWTPFPLGIVQ